MEREHNLYVLIFIPKSITSPDINTRMQFVYSSSKEMARIYAEFDEENELFYATLEVVTR